MTKIDRTWKSPFTVSTRASMTLNETQMNYVQSDGLIDKSELVGARLYYQATDKKHFIYFVPLANSITIIAFGLVLYVIIFLSRRAYYNIFQPVLHNCFGNKTDCIICANNAANKLLAKHHFAAAIVKHRERMHSIKHGASARKTGNAHTRTTERHNI